MKSKKLKKILVSFISALTITTGTLADGSFLPAGLSFAASTEGAESKPRIKISTWFPERRLTNLKAYLADKFPEYDFKFEYIDKSNYESVIDIKLAQNTEDVDIVMVDREMAQKHAANGYIVPLTRYCEGFEEEAREAFTYNDGVYAIPDTSQYQCIFCNEELFREKGVIIPYTYQTLLGSCDILREVSGIAPMAASVKDPYSMSDLTLALVSADYLVSGRGRNFGDRLQKGQTKFSEEILPFMSEWEELRNHGFITRDMYTMERRTAVEKFVNEEAAMIVGGPEIYAAVMAENPDMKIRAIPFYSNRGGRKAIIGGCDIGFAVNAQSANIDNAYRVVSSLSSIEGQRALWKDRPGTKTYLTDTEFENEDVFEGVEQCFEDGAVYTPWMDWGPQLSREVRYNLGKELQKVIVGKQGTEEAFENIDKLVEEIRSE